MKFFCLSLFLLSVIAEIPVEDNVLVLGDDNFEQAIAVRGEFNIYNYHKLYLKLSLLI